MNSPARSGISGAGCTPVVCAPVVCAPVVCAPVVCAVVVAAPDSTVTCHSFRGRGWDRQYRPDGLGVPGRITCGAVAYAACPVGRTRPRSRWDALHQTI